jgi:Fe2+ transport system protein FeoA
MSDTAGRRIPQLLHRMKEGDVVKILSISRARGIRQQLTQMGIREGDTLHVKRCVPFGGTILIEARGTSVALSKEFAEKIKVELVG